MVDEESGKGKWANWKAKDDDSLDEFPIESEHARFFSAEDLRPPLSDDEPTPPMGQKMPKKPAVVKEFSLEEIQDRLRKGAQQSAVVRRDTEGQELFTKELQQIFEAVVNQDEDFIKGLIIREFGSEEFKSTEDLHYKLDQFFSGEREFSADIDLNNPNRQPKKSGEFTFIFRPRINGSAPLIEVTLVNESGLGRRRNETITRVADVKIKEPLTVPPNTPEKPEKRGWLSGLFGKKKN